MDRSQLFKAVTSGDFTPNIGYEFMRARAKIVAKSLTKVRDIGCLKLFGVSEHLLCTLCPCVLGSSYANVCLFRAFAFTFC